MSKIIINESTEEQLIRYFLTESFVPKADLVLRIKNYIDSHFARQMLDDIADGYPTKVPTVIMMSSDKQPLKTLQMSEFLMLLDDKFHNVIKNDEDRKKFLKQVIRDWYSKSISKNGILTKNYL